MKFFNICLKKEYELLIWELLGESWRILIGHVFGARGLQPALLEGLEFGHTHTMDPIAHVNLWPQTRIGLFKTGWVMVERERPNRLLLKKFPERLDLRAHASL